MSVQEASPQYGYAASSLGSLGSRQFAIIRDNIDSLLSIFVQDCKNAEKTKNVTPLEYHCLKQLHLTVEYMSDLASKNCLEHNTVYLLMGNLLNLHEAMLKEDSQAAFYLSKKIAAIAENLTTVTRISERASRLPSYPWTRWAHDLVIRAQNNCGQTKVDDHTMQYIPKLSKFMNVVALAEDPPSIVFRALYVTAGLECVVKYHHNAEHRGIDKLKFANALIASTMNNSAFFVRYLACFSVLGGYVAVHEYCKAIDVERVLDEIQAFDFDSTIKITAQLVLAIEHLHTIGFVHRDLKHKDFLIMQNGRVKVIDYDLCRSCLGHHYKKSFPLYFDRTAAEFPNARIVGRIRYKAPEICKSESFGRASDWWALGVNIFKMYFGYMPFDAETYNGILESIKHSKLVLPDRTPHERSSPDLCNLIQGFLDQDAVKRLGSRTYADIKTHLVFSGLDFNTLWRGEIFIRNQFLDYRINRIDSRMKSRDETISRLSPDDFNERDSYEQLLGGYRISEKPPLLDTFISDNFKHVQDALLGKTFYGADSFYKRVAHYPNIDYSTEILPEESLKTPTTHVIPRQVTDNYLDISLTAGKKKKLIGLSVEFHRDQRGRPVLLVTDVKNNSVAQQEEVLVGEIITAIDGCSVSETHQQIPETGEVTLSVIVHNPFRLAVMRHDFSRVLKRSQPLQVLVPKLSLNQLTVHKSQMWDYDQQVFVNFHLILGVDKSLHIVSKQTVSLLPGDVLFKVNGTNVFGLTQWELRRLLRGLCNSNLWIDFFPISVLRRPTIGETKL